MNDYSVKPYFICKKCGFEAGTTEGDIQAMKSDKVPLPGCPFCDRMGSMKLVYRETVIPTTKQHPP